MHKIGSLLLLIPAFACAQAPSADPSRTLMDEHVVVLSTWILQNGPGTG